METRDPKFLLVDLDDVVYDTAYAVAEKLGVAYSRFVRHPDRPGWLHHPDVDDAVLFHEFQVVLPRYKLEVLPGAVTALEYARSVGWIVHFVSARQWQVTSWTRHDLIDASVYVPTRDLVWCAGKQKQELIRAHGRSTNNDVVLLDDWEPAPDARCEWVAFERPWNVRERSAAHATVGYWEQLPGVLDVGGDACRKAE